MHRINEELARAAKKAGICQQWYERLQTASPEEMMRMYIDGMDFCVKKDFPGIDYIRSHFVPYCENYGIYVDATIDNHNVRNIVALRGSSGSVSYDHYSVGEIYARHNSAIHIVAKDHAFVMINVYNDAEVSILAEDEAMICVYRYGGAVTQQITGNARIKVKDKK